MAAVAETAAPTVPESSAYAVHPAEIVGDAFARQYYAILQQSPGLVYRFYQDISKMSRFDGAGSGTGFTTTMDAINEKIQSYGSLKTDIKFVDAQESYNGGVIVLVTGSMVNEDDSRRNFTQTFFLAPQDKGYYVLNDIFRYVDDFPDSIENGSIEEQDGGIVTATASQEEAPPPAEIPNSEQSNGEVYNPLENGEVPVEEEKQQVQVKEEEPVAEVFDEPLQESWVVVESNAKVADTPKKSYASIVMKVAPATVPAPAHPKPVAKMQDRQVPVAPASISVAVSQSSNAENANNDNNQAPEAVEGHSIYAKNLPFDVPSSLVEKVFQQFGPIRTGGIQIRHSKGFCFGFVEFETAAAAQSAIQASFVKIDGHKVAIEEKRSTATRGNSFGGNNRGRYPSVRGGSGFRGEGGRGRGGYWGGRGSGQGESSKSEYGGRGGDQGDNNRSEYGGRGGVQGDGNRSEYGGRGGGHGESNRSEYGGRGGGRGYQNRSEGYHRSDQTGNRSGRVNRGDGSGLVSTRAPRVSVQA